MAVIDQPFYTILRSDRLLQPSTLPTGGRSFEYGADVPSYTLTVESLTTERHHLSFFIAACPIDHHASVL